MSCKPSLRRLSPISCHSDETGTSAANNIHTCTIHPQIKTNVHNLHVNMHTHTHRPIARNFNWGFIEQTLWLFQTKSAKLWTFYIFESRVVPHLKHPWLHACIHTYNVLVTPEVFDSLCPSLAWQ